MVRQNMADQTCKMHFLVHFMHAIDLCTHGCPPLIPDSGRAKAQGSRAEAAAGGRDGGAASQP